MTNTNEWRRLMVETPEDFTEIASAYTKNRPNRMASHTTDYEANEKVLTLYKTTSRGRTVVDALHKHKFAKGRPNIFWYTSLERLGGDIKVFKASHKSAEVPTFNSYDDPATLSYGFYVPGPQGGLCLKIALCDLSGDECKMLRTPESRQAWVDSL